MIVITKILYLLVFISSWQRGHSASVNWFSRKLPRGGSNLKKWVL